MVETVLTISSCLKMFLCHHEHTWTKAYVNVVMMLVSNMFESSPSYCCKSFSILSDIFRGFFQHPPMICSDWHQNRVISKFAWRAQEPRYSKICAYCRWIFSPKTERCEKSDMDSFHQSLIDWFDWTYTEFFSRKTSTFSALYINCEDRISWRSLSSVVDILPTPWLSILCSNQSGLDDIWGNIELLATNEPKRTPKWWISA